MHFEEADDNDNRNKGDNPQFIKPEADPEKEEEALKEVAFAINLLKSDPSLPNVVLKPVNSFYRRLQHNSVAKYGFFSASTGEGKNRALIVYRKPPKMKNHLRRS